MPRNGSPVRSLEKILSYTHEWSLVLLWPHAEIVGATEFAPNHRTYAERIAARYPRLSRDHLAEWFAGIGPTLEVDPYQRKLCGTIAVALLDAFRTDPSLWRNCGHLNDWDPNGDPTFANYLGSWTSNLQEHGLDAPLPAAVAELFKPIR